MLQSKTHFNTTSAFVLNSLSIFLFFSVCLQIIAGLLIYAQLVFENWFSLWDCFLVSKETIFEFPDWLKKVSFCEKFLKTCLFHKKWEKNSGKVEENSGNGRKHSENSKMTQKLGKKLRKWQIKTHWTRQHDSNARASEMDLWSYLVNRRLYYIITCTSRELNSWSSVSYNAFLLRTNQISIAKISIFLT